MPFDKLIKEHINYILKVKAGESEKKKNQMKIMFVKFIIENNNLPRN